MARCPIAGQTVSGASSLKIEKILRNESGTEFTLTFSASDITSFTVGYSGAQMDNLVTLQVLQNGTWTTLDTYSYSNGVNFKVWEYDVKCDGVRLVHSGGEQFSGKSIAMACLTWI